MTTITAGRRDPADEPQDGARLPGPAAGYAKSRCEPSGKENDPKADGQTRIVSRPIATLRVVATQLSTKERARRPARTIAQDSETVAAAGMPRHASADGS